MIRLGRNEINLLASAAVPTVFPKCNQNLSTSRTECLDGMSTILHSTGSTDSRVSLWLHRTGITSFPSDATSNILLPDGKVCGQIPRSRCFSFSRFALESQGREVALSIMGANGLETRRPARPQIFLPQDSDEVARIPRARHLQRPRLTDCGGCAHSELLRH